MTNKLILLLIILIPFFSSSQLSEKDKEILRQELSGMINNLRESKGLKPLLFNDTLKMAAEFHSEYMAKNDILSHEQRISKYRTPAKRVVSFNGEIFTTVGENVLYTTAQNLPRNKKDLFYLAEEMFNSWKNSPGHYANMIEPSYVYGDLGFKRDPKKNIIYATHVFGTKGYVVLNQLSENTFKLRKERNNCEKELAQFKHRIFNMGNNLEIIGNEIVLSYHSAKDFKEVFPGYRDGIAIDLISPEQLECGKPNQFDYSPIHDGILLEPVYSRELIKNNRAVGDYRMITKVGEIPEYLQGKEYSPSLIFIKNGQSCPSVYPVAVPYKDYDLLPVTPIVKDEPSVKLVKTGVKKSQTVIYDFERNNTNAIDYPEIKVHPETIHSIHIQTYSSVEGNVTHNTYLHNSRAQHIKNQIQSRLQVPSNKFIIDARENWDLMNFQLGYYQLDSLEILSRDSLRSYLSHPVDSVIAYDSLLLSQRKSVAIINYFSRYQPGENQETLGEFNLRTAVATQNTALANKALYEMYQSADYNSELLFEDHIIEFMKSNAKTVANYAALLSFHTSKNAYKTIQFIDVWRHKTNELDAASRHNLMHLYTLVGNELLSYWDVSSESLSNVIHPTKITRIKTPDYATELYLNQQLTFLQYYGQINDKEKRRASFDFISNYFKNSKLSQADDVKLALFFNMWSAYDYTIDYLVDHYKRDNLNEEGLFILSQTMHIMGFYEKPELYIEVNEKALKTNQALWCRLIKENSQVKRNLQIKRLYCEVCE